MESYTQTLLADFICHLEKLTFEIATEEAPKTPGNFKQSWPSEHFFYIRPFSSNIAKTFQTNEPNLLYVGIQHYLGYIVL